MENFSGRDDHGPREQLAIAKRGQILGFGALILMLASIVTLAALGQPWVAGIVATTGGLPVIVALFVTGQYRPSPATVPEIVQQQTGQLPDQGAPNAPPPPVAIEPSQ